MSTRRMFTQKITSSARFLKMSPSAQSLYFHLGMNADDDGVVEAYTIMQLINAAEDDFKVLVAKNFIKPLNDDLVSFILDWNEHNYIRADRKIDSRYKNLLIQVLPDAKTIDAKPRSDVKNNSNRVNGLRPDGLFFDEVNEEECKPIKYTPEDMECVELLTSLIIENNPAWTMKGNKEKWAEDINKLHRIDLRTYEQIKYMINWVQKDSFWSQNILSASKLRDKFNDLIPRVKGNKNINNKNNLKNVII